MLVIELRQNTLLGAHVWRVGATPDTEFAQVPVISPVSSAADISLWDALEVVRTLHQAGAAAPGATELLGLVQAAFTGGGTIAHQAGREAAAQVSGTGNVVLVVTLRTSGRTCQYEDQHAAQLYHISCSEEVSKRNNLIQRDSHFLFHYKPFRFSKVSIRLENSKIILLLFDIIFPINLRSVQALYYL